MLVEWAYNRGATVLPHTQPDSPIGRFHVCAQITLTSLLKVLGTGVRERQLGQIEPGNSDIYRDGPRALDG